MIGRNRINKRTLGLFRIILNYEKSKKRKKLQASSSKLDSWPGI